MITLPPRIDSRSQSEKLRRWMLFWGKWSIWITVLFTTPLLPPIIFYVMQYGIHLEPTLASQFAIVVAGLGIGGGGLVTVASWIVVRDSSMQAWGENASIVKGLLISAVVGLVVELGLFFLFAYT